MNVRSTIASGAILLVSIATYGTRAADAPQPVVFTQPQLDFYEKKIRPLLSDRCYKCHATTSEKIKGALTIDTAEGFLKAGDSGKAAVVPNDPDKSFLIEAVKYTNADTQMPPKEKLSDQQIADLVEWVKMGAPASRSSGGGKLSGMTEEARHWWAYQPVSKPELPPVKNSKWIKSPIDTFVLNKLEANHLDPNPKANREALLRRATYDLIGLPPTVEELDAFTKDPAPDDQAYEKVVDRLLASPHYGERWGRYWLDTARYSDTTGEEKENRSTDYRYAYAWTYRDWVIKAVNEDLPYDQFLLKQMAADLLPETAKHTDDLAALGFLTVGKRFPDVNDVIDERIDTITKATIASTVSCARCHTHKFDPIPTDDYYSLFGILSSCLEPKELPMIGHIPTGAEAADFQSKLAKLESKNRDIFYDYAGSKGEEFRKQANHYLMGKAYDRKGDIKSADAKRKLIEDFKLDTQMLQRLKLRGDKDVDAVMNPFFWFEQAGDNLSSQASEILDRIAKAGKQRVNPLVAAAFKGASISSLSDAADIYAKLFASVESKAKHCLQSARQPGASSIEGFDEATLQVINFPVKIEPYADMTMEHIREVAPKLMIGVNAYAPFLFGAINELELTHPGCPQRAMVLKDSPSPKDAPVLIKGEKNRKGKLVPRENLLILGGEDRKPFKEGSGRLEFAQCIASKQNPLTARVAVNRIWMHHMGDGLVPTPDDFGTKSQPPTHPELMDYLANRFMEDNWSLKKMHKRIMLSATYRQSADADKPLYVKADPGNKWLWHANVHRLDFEAIRDTMLLYTGKLDKTVGGRPVNITDEPYSFRRSVYGYIDRGNLPELLQQFDFSDPNRCNSKRTSTIVPQQALFFMNSPMSADVVRNVVKRPEFLNARDDYARVRALYRVLFQRMPRDRELNLAIDFYNAHHNMKMTVVSSGGTSSAKAKPKSLGSSSEAGNTMMKPGGDKNVIQNAGGEMVEKTELSLWEQYAQALLMSNEIVYVN